MPMLLEFDPHLQLGLFVLGMPVQVINFVHGSQVQFRLAVTLETPGHGEGLLDAHHLHFIDLAMAGRATDAPAHMHGVIEINEIRKVVNADPWNGLTGFMTDTNRFESRTVRKNQVLAMTVHACVRRRDVRVRRLVDMTVAIPAIDAELPGV